MIERDIHTRIITASGTPFWPLNPRPEDVNLRDISHALGNLCRYCGHTTEFYSVAQHSVLVSHIVPEELALCGLLHDASEAYIADISRPIKPHLSNYAEIEDRLMQCIAGVFAFPYPFPPAIKQADMILAATERRDVCPAAYCPLIEGYVPLKETIEPWSPTAAASYFRRRFYEITRTTPTGVQRNWSMV